MQETRVRSQIACSNNSRANSYSPNRAIANGAITFSRTQTGGITFDVIPSETGTQRNEVEEPLPIIGVSPQNKQRGFGSVQHDKRTDCGACRGIDVNLYGIGPGNAVDNANTDTQSERFTRAQRSDQFRSAAT